MILETWALRLSVLGAVVEPDSFTVFETRDTSTREESWQVGECVVLGVWVRVCVWVRVWVRVSACVSACARTNVSSGERVNVMHPLRGGYKGTSAK